MEFRQFGQTGLNVSRICFGCAPIGGYDYGPVDDADSVKAVRKAYELGINFFDTADIYGFGRAETVLSKALGKDKNKVIIATKFGLKRGISGNIVRDCTPKNIVESLEKSLRRLRVESISLYQIHWPDPNVLIEDTLRALMECQKKGKVRHIGCSNFDSVLFAKSQKTCRIESSQIPYNLLDREAEKADFGCCKKFGASVLTHSSLARGYLAGKSAAKPAFNGTDTRGKSKYFSNFHVAEKSKLMNVMAGICSKNEKNMAQTAVRWILDNPSVTSAIVGLKNKNQVEDIAGSVDWRLSDIDYNNLCDATKIFANPSC